MDKAQEKLLEIKHKIPFFKDLMHSDIKNVCKSVSFKKYEKNKIILEQGVMNEKIHYLLEGHVQIMVGSTSGSPYSTQVMNFIKFCTLERGHIFGEISAFTKNPTNARVIAQDTCIVLSFELDTDSEYTCPVFLKMFQTFIHDLGAKLTDLNEVLYKKKLFG